MLTIPEGVSIRKAIREMHLHNSLENWFDTSGTGVDFKLGVIIRPFESSSFRIGAAIHTPTWFNLEDRASAIMTSDVDMNSDGTIDKDELYEYDTMDFPGESKNKV